MGLLGKKKQTAFSIRLTPTGRDKAAELAGAVGDKAIRALAREKKKEAARDALVDRAEAIKEAAREREEERRKAKKKEDDKARRARRSQERTERSACTCKKPRLGRDGKCSRCHKTPAARRRGFFS